MIKRWPLVLLFSLLLTLFIAPAALADDIRVLLSSSTNEIQEIYIEDGGYDLLDEQGQYVTNIRRDSRVTIESTRRGYEVYVRGKLVMEGVTELTLAAADDDEVFEYKDRLYRGDLRFVSNGSVAYVINTLDIEYYLYGVVGREIGYNQPLEAAKAQAVASRSFAVASLNPGNKYYDIGTGTSAQAYGGYTAELEAAVGNIIRAVDATEGEIICYKGNPFEGFYHSNAGGHTEDLVNIWGGNTPLKGVPSPYDDYVEKSGYSSSIYRWQVSYTTAELRDLAERYAGKSIGAYKGIEISTLDEQGRPSVSGRVLEVTIKGSDGTVTAKRDAVRSLLGNLKSSLFTLDGEPAVQQSSQKTTNELYVLDKGWTAPQKVEDTSVLFVRGGDNMLTRLSEWLGDIVLRGAREDVIYGTPSQSKTVTSAGTTSNSSEITIYGKGSGHGVGMSQWGAIGMAEDGYDYEEIIAHYFNMDTNSNFTIEDDYK